MTRLIEAKTRLEAWIEACKYLETSNHCLNLILSIKNPENNGPSGSAANKTIDAFLSSQGEYSTHTVAETIFPAWEYRRSGFAKLADIYNKETLPRLKGAPGIRWGTYANRLLYRKRPDGSVINPLADIIKKLKNEASQAGPKRACYEVGVAEGMHDEPIGEGAYDAPLYGSTKDDTLRRGLPCLSHLSFKLLEGRVHLTAMYRSHDYSDKVYGNLLGLARLQACVASEAGVGLGSLVVHSTYAFVDETPAMRALIKSLEPLTQKEREGHEMVK